MTTITESKKTITAAAALALALGAPLEGGTFQGVITLPSGAHVAVVLLADKPDSRLTWRDAQAWAATVGGELPTRPVAALLYANAKAQFERTWYWTNDRLDADTGDESDASYAWGCDFGDGSQYYDYTSASGAARAVRLIHLEG